MTALAFDSDWTLADAAEQDVLLHELARGYADDHRPNCEWCRYPRCQEHRRRVCVDCKAGCPYVLSYFQHRADCWRCRNSIKVATTIYGEPCRRYLDFVAHGNTCKPCNLCPHQALAIRTVLDWREARQLLTRAQALRIETTAHIDAMAGADAESGMDAPASPLTLLLALLGEETA